MPRTIAIEVTNRTGFPLTFQVIATREGPAAAASISPVPNGGTTTITASNPSLTGSCEGTFTLNFTEVQPNQPAFTIAYYHPRTRDSRVTLTAATPGFLGKTDLPAYPGNPVNARLDLYQGVPVPDGQQLPVVVPLAPAPYTQRGNCQDFANSLFDPGVRAEQIIAGGLQNPYTPADYTGDQLNQIIDTLYAAWTVEGGPPEGARDKAILNFLANYIAPGFPRPPIQMWVPRIEYTQMVETPEGQLAGYALRGYDRIPLATYEEEQIQWVDNGIRSFLQLLLSGAHFVAIHAPSDFANQGLNNTGRNLLREFRTSGLPRCIDPLNSHYGKNLTGDYYLDISEDFAPRNANFLLALLFGKTVNSKFGAYNTFMQLEGWQTVVTPNFRNTRHMADFAAYQRTLWNISTFGACPFSEKRGTTVFLAPAGEASWTPRVYQITRMMPYVGAYALGRPPNGRPQPWLSTALVQIDEDEAPALPDAYYV
ncbi:MAG TPA: hypothetical protein VMH86_06080 [Rhizomicrobium sp.]|nr:hypothetical protein [Rhizomicrobium sp.]